MSSPVASTSTQMVEEQGRQAEPLPVKRGEIGYQEGQVQTQPRDDASGSGTADNDVTMPARHPMDDPPASSNTESNVGSSASSQTGTSNVNGSSDSNPSSNPSSTQKPPKNDSIWGIRYVTWARFFFQLALIAGTIVAWVLIIVLLGNKLDQGSPPTLENPNGSVPSNTAQIFVYVAFGVATLAQLLFLERAIFQMRAERYCHIHPECRMPGVACLRPADEVWPLQWDSRLGIDLHCRRMLPLWPRVGTGPATLKTISSLNRLRLRTETLATVRSSFRLHSQIAMPNSDLE